MSDSERIGSLRCLVKALECIASDAESLHYCLVHFYFDPGRTNWPLNSPATAHRFSVSESTAKRLLQRIEDVFGAIPATEDEFRTSLTRIGIEADRPGELLDYFLKFLEYYRAVVEVVGWFAEMRASLSLQGVPRSTNDRPGGCQRNGWSELGMSLFNGWGVLRPLLRTSEPMTPPGGQAANQVTPGPVDATLPQETTTRIEAQPGDILIRGGDGGLDGPGRNVFIIGGDGGPDANGGAVVIHVDGGRRAENPTPASVAAVPDVQPSDTPPKQPAPVAKPQNTARGGSGLVFISYSHKDNRGPKKWLDDLRTHLIPYLREGSMTAWSDQQIKAGSEWFADIERAIARTRVAVLLVTPSFLASDFIREHELCPLLKSAQDGGVRILWIPVRASSYHRSPLKDIQALIPPDKPLEQMKAERNEAWVSICEQIAEAASC